MTTLIDTNFDQHQEAQHHHKQKRLLTHDWMMNLAFFQRRSSSSSGKPPQLQQHQQSLVPLARNPLEDTVAPESDAVRKPRSFARVSSCLSHRSSQKSRTLPEKTPSSSTSAAPGEAQERKRPPSRAASRAISFISADQLMEDPLRGEVPSVVYFSLVQKENVMTGDQDDYDDVSEVSLDDFDTQDQEPQLHDLVLQAKLAELGLSTGLPSELRASTEDSLDENCLLHLSSSCSSSTSHREEHGGVSQQQQHIPLDCSWLKPHTNEAWGMTISKCDGGSEWPSDEDKSPLKAKTSQSKLLVGDDIYVFETASQGNDAVGVTKHEHNIVWTTEDGGAIETVHAAL